MGSGITVSAHRDGRMIDNNTPEEGPFGPDRSGSLPVQALIKVCCNGAYNAKQLDRMVFGEGGLFAYLGTRDLKEVERRMDVAIKLRQPCTRPWSTRSPRKLERWQRRCKAQWMLFF